MSSCVTLPERHGSAEQLPLPRSVGDSTCSRWSSPGPIASRPMRTMTRALRPTVERSRSSSRPSSVSEIGALPNDILQQAVLREVDAKRLQRLVIERGQPARGLSQDYAVTGAMMRVYTRKFGKRKWLPPPFAPVPGIKHVGETIVDEARDRQHDGIAKERGQPALARRRAPHGNRPRRHRPAAVPRRRWRAACA